MSDKAQNCKSADLTKAVFRSMSWALLDKRFDHYQRPSLEVSCSTLLTVLATAVMRRGKKPAL